MSKRKSSLFWLLFLLVASMVMIETASLITIKLGTKNNLWLWHIYSPVQFGIIAAIYYQCFRRPLFKQGVLVLAAAFVLFCIGNAAIGEGITQLNSVPRMVENVLIIIITIFYFYKISHDLSITYLDRDPVFLLSCGLLIYKAGNSMSQAMFNVALEESYDAARMCLAIIFVLNVLFNSSLVFVLKRASDR